MPRASSRFTYATISPAMPTMPISGATAGNRRKPARPPLPRRRARRRATRRKPAGHRRQRRFGSGKVGHGVTPWQGATHLAANGNMRPPPAEINAFGRARRAFRQHAPRRRQGVRSSDASKSNAGTATRPRSPPACATGAKIGVRHIRPRQSALIIRFEYLARRRRAG